jgi:hypothetical protein
VLDIVEVPKVSTDLLLILLLTMKDQSHNGETLAATLVEVLKGNNIEEKVCTISVGKGCY